MTMKLGSQTTSLVNHLYSSSTGAPEPAVGLGVTVLGWTDRKAGTIVEVSERGFTVRLDTVRRTDSSGMSDSQSYAYEPNPQGLTYKFRRVTRGRAKGAWREGGRTDGSGVLVGARDHYHDFSF